jgi:GTP 3',8-cyclase
MKNELNYLSIPNGGIRLSVTNICNMDCFYCHNEGQNKNKRQDLSFIEFRKIIDIGLQFSLKNISFTGGEPLLNPDIFKMIACCKDVGLKKIDLCTNGISIDKYIDQLKKFRNLALTIGIDTVDKEKISKQSKIGKKFSEIEKNLFLLEKNKIKFSINSVYTGENFDDAIEMIKYCRENKFELRIIEKDTYKKITNDKISEIFSKFIKKVEKEFNLKIGYMQPGKGYFGIHSNKARVNFYNAKCHSRDCLNCARCHFRIDSSGFAIPCYAKDLRIPILGKKPETANKNFLKAIYNLGIPPEKESIL